jgi:hypothetical protein
MSKPAYEGLLAACSKPEGPAVIESAVLSLDEANRLAADLEAVDIHARVIDGAWVADKADLIRHLALAFEFPSYFGGGWDAVIDCWSDMSWLPGRGYVCVMPNADVFRAVDARAHETLLEVCEDVAERWREYDPTVVFKLVRGARS